MPTAQGGLSNDQACNLILTVIAGDPKIARKRTDIDALVSTSSMKRIAARIAVYCLVMLLLSCHTETQTGSAPIFSYRLRLSNDSLLNFETLKNNKASVFVFLAPDCPLSQSYTPTLNELHSRFSDSNVGFYGVVESSKYERKEIEDYITQYRIDLPVVLDAHSELARLFAATVTPEVFVLDSKGHTVYFGAIDNRAPELGQKRTVITEHYLMDALNGFLRDGTIPVGKTKPVGCFIELGN